MKSSNLIRFGLFLLLTAAASCCFAQTYTMIDIGAPPGDGFAVPRGVNASGQITGATGPGGDSGSSEVFIYSNGKFTNLGTLGGDSGIGNGINASGQVAGYSTNAAGTYRAFISKGKSLIDIGDLGGGSAVAYAINDAGQVVGSSVTADGSNHPFMYSNGKMIDLGTLGSPQGGSWWNSAEGINKYGVAVGYSYTNQNQAPLLGFAWFKGKIHAMGSLGGGMSQAYAINNRNQATGIGYLANGDAHAFIVDASGKMKDLGALEQYGTSWGFGINDSGVVVGQAQLSSGVHAFVYNGKKMLDLNSLVPQGSGLTLIEADSVNDAGQIACTGEDSQGNSHAVLLTPQ
jgi:probable HAF family extracellular repeat protein